MDEIYIHLYKKKILIQLFFSVHWFLGSQGTVLTVALGQHRFGLYRVGGEGGRHESGAAYLVSLWQLQTGQQGPKHGLCGLVAAQPSR